MKKKALEQQKVKPCPFCGAEGELYTGKNKFTIGHCVIQHRKGCVFIELSNRENQFMNPEQIGKWNNMKVVES